ncbi:MAG: hypothetical protein FD174_4293 [Geobacteraceae bacterium]|nr:MAG: hypothetical protein FD174_4293 [Geobacteraceae bacterium]
MGLTQRNEGVGSSPIPYIDCSRIQSNSQGAEAIMQCLVVFGQFCVLHK